MASGVGEAVIAFGAAPGTNIAETTVTGQTDIPAGAYVEAWFMGDSTADHNGYEHARILPLKVSLAAENVVAGVGFTLVAASEMRITGDVKCRYVWSD